MIKHQTEDFVVRSLIDMPDVDDYVRGCILKTIGNIKAGVDIKKCLRDLHAEIPSPARNIVHRLLWSCKVGIEE